MSRNSAIEPAFESMRIAVIGAGWMGGAVGKAWVRAGHEVMFASRHPEKLEKSFRHLGGRARVGSVREAVEFAQVVLLTVPYAALAAIGDALNPLFSSRLILDAANPSSDPTSRFAKDAFAAGVGITTQHLLGGATVVRAFSCVDATEVDASSQRSGDRLCVPIAGDDARAVSCAERLVRDAGCEPLFVGTLASAKQFERGTQAFRANATLPRLKAILNLL